ncbi:MAG: hypothetical protein A2571_01235 [Candidatus Vogelbacteria bacterium RIFOXYD1_FULL_44_32]|uniref:LTD domain-containing protein n=1 Tax=Candidatus Vogelbacteria bacterium RIFOXYD1_FULL_44_32 TaxID=1802438 RepID=A0A1G2QEZ0_9BACT|nr:MAG: hypothetical protein A2571_01235 [Candidatus Vogelbacteria bacterium RIFOXYD1_FULL_44_32]
MKYTKGELDNELLIFIGIFLVLGLAWVTMSPDTEKAKQQPLTGIFQNINPGLVGTNSSPSGSQSASAQGKKEETTITLAGWTYTKSPWYGQVELSAGNARSQSRANMEYVVLGSNNQNKDNINITGWKLENGRGRKITEPAKSKAVVLPSQWSTIPRGAELFLLDKSVLGPVILWPGDKAIITTGSLKTGGDLPVRVSFKTNLCTGYLADNKRNEFIPTLRRNCPKISVDPEASKMSDECYKFIRNYPTCHTPDTKPYRNYLGDLIKNHIDKNTAVSKLCRGWIISRASYSTCVANNLAAKDFTGDEWRIFLNRDWELWDNDREVITLYDTNGLLVDQISY